MLSWFFDLWCCAGLEEVSLESTLDQSELLHSEHVRCREFDVCIPQDDGVAIGITVARDSLGHLQVVTLDSAEDTAVARWNHENPSSAIGEKDSILTVKAVSGCMTMRIRKPV